jgi:hypothetical protein
MKMLDLLSLLRRVAASQPAREFLQVGIRVLAAAIAEPGHYTSGGLASIGITIRIKAWGNGCEVTFWDHAGLPVSLKDIPARLGL